MKSENETLKHQLGSATQQVPLITVDYINTKIFCAVQVSQINAMTDAEKREKQIVLRKLAEMEEELKVNNTINLIPKL